MLMYTSCGWFFDELSGIETVQVIQYAGRAAQLAEELFGNPAGKPLHRKAEPGQKQYSRASGWRPHLPEVRPARLC